MLTWLLNTIFPENLNVVIELKPEEDDTPIVREALARMHQIELASDHPAIRSALQNVLTRVIPHVRIKGSDPRIVEDLLTQELEHLDSTDPSTDEFRKARKLFVAFCAFLDQSVQKDEQPTISAKKSRKRSSITMRDDTPIKAFVPKSSAKRRRKILVSKPREQLLLDAVVSKLQDMVDYDEDSSNIHLDSDPVEAAQVVRQLYKCLHLLKFSEK